MNDTFDLKRFLDAQSQNYECALQEIKNGLKRNWNAKRAIERGELNKNG